MAQKTVFLYGGVDHWEVSAEWFKNEIEGFAEGDEIDVRIFSPGGSVFEGFAIYSLMKHSQAKFTAHIDGLAASIASVIAMGANEVVVSEGSMMMIHEAWSIGAGGADEFKDQAEALEKINQELVSIYQKKTGLEIEELENLISKDTYLTSKELVEYGFADRYEEELPLVAVALKEKVEQLKKGETMTVENTQEEVKAETEKVETFTKEEVQEQIENALKERKEFEAKIDGLSLHEDQKELLASIKEEEGMTLEKAQGLVIADFQENQGKYTTVQLNKDALVAEAPEAVEVVAEVEEKEVEPSKDELKAQWTKLKAQGKFKEASEIRKQIQNLK